MEEPNLRQPIAPNSRSSARPSLPLAGAPAKEESKLPLKVADLSGFNPYARRAGVTGPPKIASTPRSSEMPSSPSEAELIGLDSSKPSPPFSPLDAGHDFEQDLEGDAGTPRASASQDEADDGEMIDADAYSYDDFDEFDSFGSDWEDDENGAAFIGEHEPARVNGDAKDVKDIGGNMRMRRRMEPLVLGQSVTSAAAGMGIGADAWDTASAASAEQLDPTQHRQQTRRARTRRSSKSRLDRRRRGYRRHDAADADADVESDDALGLGVKWSLSRTILLLASLVVGLAQGRSSSSPLGPFDFRPPTSPRSGGTSSWLHHIHARLSHLLQSNPSHLALSGRDVLALLLGISAALVMRRAALSMLVHGLHLVPADKTHLLRGMARRSWFLHPSCSTSKHGSKLYQDRSQSMSPTPQSASMSVGRLRSWAFDLPRAALGATAGVLVVFACSSASLAGMVLLSMLEVRLLPTKAILAPLLVGVGIGCAVCEHSFRLMSWINVSFLVVVLGTVLTWLANNQVHSKSRSLRSAIGPLLLGTGLHLYSCDVLNNAVAACMPVADLFIDCVGATTRSTSIFGTLNTVLVAACFSALCGSTRAATSSAAAAVQRATKAASSGVINVALRDPALAARLTIGFSLGEWLALAFAVHAFCAPCACCYRLVKGQDRNTIACHAIGSGAKKRATLTACLALMLSRSLIAAIALMFSPFFTAFTDMVAAGNDVSIEGGLATGSRVWHCGVAIVLLVVPNALRTIAVIARRIVYVCVRT